MLRVTAVASSVAALWTSWPVTMSSSRVCGPPEVSNARMLNHKNSKMQRTCLRELQRFEPNLCNKGRFKDFEPLSRLQAKFKCMMHSVSWKADWCSAGQKKIPAIYGNLNVQHHVHNNKCIPDGIILCNARSSSPEGTDFSLLLHRPDWL
jgi:hypothetical protein